MQEEIIKKNASIYKDAVPISVHPVEIISNIAAEIDKDKFISLDVLRSNIAALFDGINSFDLRVYEDSSNADESIFINLYEDCILMLRECKQETLTCETFNLLACKYDLEAIQNISESNNNEDMVDLKLFDSIISVIVPTIFLGVPLFIVLEYIVPVLNPEFDVTWTPYIVAIMCMIMTIFCVTSMISNDFSEIKKYSTYLDNIKNKGSVVNESAEHTADN